MRKTVLYIGMSLDGYIADRGGGVGWMDGQDGGGTEESYAGFLAAVDTVVMGWNTYHQIVTELSPGQWPYEGLSCYVLTSRSLPDLKEIHFTSRDPAALVRALKKEPGKDLWICGGAKAAQTLLKEDLIDEWRISILPTLLGAGIALFGPMDRERKLRLTGVQTENGITELRYTRR